MPDRSFADKVAIVTGGGSGIGQAMCELLAQRGAKVVVADINSEDAERVSETIVRGSGQAESARVDVSKEEEVRRLVDYTSTSRGRLDYMFNNAGIAIGGDVRDLTLDQWRRVLDVDLYGVLYGSLAAYRVMARQGFGHIVNTSSGDGLFPQPGNAPYSTSKHAVVGLSLNLRFEGADLGVKVSVVCPGRVRTNIWKKSIVAGISPEQSAGMLSNGGGMEAPEAAKVILDGVARNKPMIVFPAGVNWAWRLYRICPGLLDRTWLNRIRELRKLRATSAVEG